MPNITDSVFLGFCAQLFNSPLPLIDEFFLPSGSTDIQDLSIEDFCFYASSTRHASLYMNAFSVSLPNFLPKSLFSDDDLTEYLEGLNLSVDTLEIISAIKYLYNFKKNIYNLTVYIDTNQALDLSDIPSQLRKDIPFKTIPVIFKNSLSVGSVYTLPEECNFISIFGWFNRAITGDISKLIDEIISKKNKLENIIDTISREQSFDYFDF